MPGWHASAAQSSGPNATARPADDAPRPAETSVQAALREVACGIDNRGAFDAGWSATDPASDRLRRDALASRAETVGALRALLQVWFVRACLLAHFGHGVLSTASEDDTIDALGASPAARSLSGSSSGIGRRCCTAVASCAAPVGGGCSASPLPATSSKRSVVDMEAALASTAAMLLSERERGSVCQAHLCGNPLVGEAIMTCVPADARPKKGTKGVQVRMHISQWRPPSGRTRPRGTWCTSSAGCNPRPPLLGRWDRRRGGRRRPAASARREPIHRVREGGRLLSRRIDRGCVLHKCASL